MSNFYIVEIGGSQQKVSVGEEITTDRIGDKEVGDKVEIAEVVLSSDEGKVTVGKPFVGKLKASFEVIKHMRGEKLEIRKFRAKSRYHKKIGFRPDLTVLKLIEVK